jgi:hypothetical protein
MASLDEGANAVLLKMDEFRGRLGTRGALVRKGAKPEADALPSLPVADLRAVTVSNTDADALLSAEQKRSLIAEMRKTVSDEDCDGFARIVSGDTTLSVYQLSGEKRMVSAECWRAAYDRGAAHWVINKRQPFAPVIVVADATDYVGGFVGNGHGPATGSLLPQRAARACVA